MGKGLLILGTDNGVGKSYVSTLIFKKLLKLGLNVGYYKPIVLGSTTLNDNIPYADEVENIYGNADIKVNGNDFASYVYSSEFAPYISSAIEQNPIDINKIKEDFYQISTMFDYLIVEGLDNICLPISNDTGNKIFPVDLIREFNLSSIVVTDTRESCVSDTCLQTHFLLSHDIDVRGIIMNRFDKEKFSDIDSKELIEDILGGGVLACVSVNESNLNILVNKLKDLFSDIIIDFNNPKILEECDPNLG